MAKITSVKAIRFPGSLRHLVLAMSMAMPGSVMALSLGDITLDTVLNEPLRAEIDLDAISPQELKDLKVSLGSAEVFKRLGMARPSYLNDLEFEPKLAASGEPIIVVKTKQPVKEPFLNFLVEVQWPKGRLLREYTLLLDPPVTGVQRAPQPSAPEVSQPERPSPPPLRPEVAVNNEPARASTPAPVPQAPSKPVVTKTVESDSSTSAPVDSIYTVRKNDTLSEIAIRTRPVRTPLDQMMIAIYEANPDAFFKNNINNLKSGVVLRLPNQDAISAIQPGRASELVVEHVAEWRESLGLAPLTAQDVAIVDSSSSADTPSGSVGGDQDDRSKLEILGNDEAIASADSAKPAPQMVAELRLAQELAETRAKENSELSDRVSQLEALMEKQQRIIEIQNRDMAELQERLRKAELGLPATPETDADTGEGATLPDDADGKTEQTAPPESDGDNTRSSAQDAAVAAGDDAGGISTGTESAQADANVESSLTESGVAAQEDSTPESPAAPPEPDSKAGLWIAGLLVALGVAGAVGFVRRRDNKAGSSDSHDSDFGIAPQPVVADAEDPSHERHEPAAVERQASKSEQAFAEFTKAQDEPAKPAALTATPAISASEDEIPDSQDAVLADADVYLAYGLHQQAEQLLKEALQKEPGRDDYRVKLLEAYSNAKDSSKFEYLAREFFDRVGGNHPSWPQVAKMGRVISPGNALFSEDQTAASQMSSSQRTASAPANDTRLEHRDKFRPHLASDAQEDELASFGAEFKEPRSSRGDSYALNPDQNSGGEDFAFSEDAGAKLELAKAYMDMGDEEGARSLIDEIIAVGNETQRAQARELSDRIS